MKKALIITTVSGFLPQFEMGNAAILKELGYEVHYASNFQTPFYGKDNSRLEGAGIICHQIDFPRSPFRMGRSFRAYRELKALSQQENFQLVHCHTPMGGALGRLVFKAKQNVTILYTAHGFHFYKGAPLHYWLFYYPIERWLSRYTDILATINREDYNRAKKCLHAKRTEYVPGVGIDTDKIKRMPSKREEKRRELEIPMNTYLMVSVGELSKRKNHITVLRALAFMKHENFCYVICGHGPCEKDLIKAAKKYGIGHKVKFLGYRKDVTEIEKCADLFLFPSLQEGLPVALMEAMAAGIPCIASDIRGNRDLLKEDELAPPKDVRAYYKKIQEKNSLRNIRNMEKYDAKAIKKRWKEIYESCEYKGTAAGFQRNYEQ